VAKSRKKYRQVAALPYRLTAAGWEVALVTTRESGRWILPKGWPIKGLPDFEAAAIEALEEAGMVGRIGRRSIGEFVYLKRFVKTSDKVTATVYPLAVVEQRPKWREKNEREVRWFSAAEAAEKVTIEGVGALIERFVAGLAGASDEDSPPAAPGSDI
jgi:8-oxo-dGTP pyrophosphatase MutT (NUDIX family)